MAVDITYAGAGLAGFISFLSPCVLPLVPPYLCYLGGTTFDQLAGESSEQPERAVYFRVITAALMFVAGFTTVFVALGATASSLGQLVASHIELLSKMAGVVIILFGLHFLGIFRIPLFMREARFQSESRPGSFFGAYLIGLAFAFGWTPCIGPVLAAILFVAAGEETVTKGTTLLLAYSIGLGLPFILAALAIKPFLRFARHFRHHFGKVEKVMGGFLVLTGLLFLSGSFNVMSIWLLETFPGLAELG